MLKVTQQVNDRVGLEPDTYNFNFIDPLNKLLLGTFYMQADIGLKKMDKGLPWWSSG